MRLDTANRTFVDLVAVAAAPVVLFALLSCGPVALAGGWTKGHDHSSLPAEFAHWTALGFAAVAVVAVIRFARALLRQWRASRRVASDVARRRLPTGHRLGRVAAEMGLSRIDVTDAEERYSFTYGLWWPRVVVSRRLLDSVSDSELEAVLAHEQYHVRNRDPLKMMIGRALTPGLFLLPMTRHLLDRYLTVCELAADRSAMARCGSAPLAGAIYKVMSAEPVVPGGAVAALSGAAVLDVRLVQLESGSEPPTTSISPRAVHATVIGLLLISLGIGSAAVTVTGDVTFGPALGWMHGAPLSGAWAWLCLGLCLSGVVAVPGWLLRRSF